MASRAFLSLCAMFLLSTATFAQPRAVTIDDILGLKNVGSATVSPDGTQVLYTVRQWENERDRMEPRTRIWKVSVNGGDARQLTFGERGDTQPQWSPDGRYVSFLSARGTTSPEETPRPQLFVMRTDGGEAWKLTDAKEGVASYSWSPDSRRVAYVATDPRTPGQEVDIKRRDDERQFENDFRYSHIWTIDLESQSATRLTEGSSWTVRGTPSWSADGTRLVFAANVTTMTRDARSDIFLVHTATRQVEKISSNPATDGQPEWSPDGTLIAWVSELEMGKPLPDGTLPTTIALNRLVIYDVGKKLAKDVSSRDFDTDAGSPRWSPDSKAIIFTAGRRAYTEVFRFDVATGKYSPLTQQKTLQLGTRSHDGRVIALTMDSPTEPSDVYVTDGSFARFKKLTDTNPHTKNFALGEAEVVKWKSADGVEVEGILLKPVGYQSGQKYPMLVVAHGGPAGAFVNNYRVGGLEGGQLWAGQGWAVLYPNPRGSSNYGEKFLQANILDWGGGDYRDIMTGVDAMVARGVADPNRLAHIGWSYGGYMTAWVITQTNRFKAAMVGAGLTNLYSMYGTNDIPNVMNTYFGGVAGRQTMGLYSERSAMTHIDKVTTPTLILHGANDERVPTGQAHELYRGLKDRGKAVELVFYPREGHGIAEYYHLKDRLTRIQEWVTKHTLTERRKTTSQ